MYIHYCQGRNFFLLFSFQRTPLIFFLGLLDGYFGIIIFALLGQQAYIWQLQNLTKNISFTSFRKYHIKYLTIFVPFWSQNSLTLVIQGNPSFGCQSFSDKVITWSFIHFS